MSLENVRNIGPATAEWLREIGITSREQMVARGSVAVYRQLKAAFPKAVSLNALWALEAAVIDIDWRDLPAERKAELREQLAANED